MGKVLHFFPHPLVERHGGPYSVLYHLKQGLRNLQHNVDFLEDLYSFTPEPDTNQQAGLLKRWIRPLIPASAVTSYKINQWLKEIDEPDERVIRSVDVSAYDALHFHEPVDIWRYRRMLDTYKGKVLLQSHSPKPYHLEVLEEQFGKDKQDISDSLYKKLESIDSLAFSRADDLVFPCVQAKDEYLHCWKDFAALSATKHTGFVPTGVDIKSSPRTASETRKSLSIPQDAFVATFVGRKRPVKGYDLLVELAKRLLSQYRDLYFVVAGKKSPDLPFEQARYIETGWSQDPYSFVQAGDLHLVPNRFTNFDLNVLEAMALGKPLLLSNTGGNQYFSTFMSSGIFYHAPTIDDLEKKFLECYHQKGLLAQAGIYNKKLHETHFTTTHFAQRMLAFYKTINL